MSGSVACCDTTIATPRSDSGSISVVADCHTIWQVVISDSTAFVAFDMSRKKNVVLMAGIWSFLRDPVFKRPMFTGSQ